MHSESKTREYKLTTLKGSMSGTHEALTWRRLAKLVGWFVVDTLVTVIPPPRRANRTLVVRLDNIGDFILWLADAQMLAEHYRQLGNEVILVASSPWAGWARELGIFDRVLSLNRNRFQGNPLERFRLASEIRRLGCSVAILPAYSRSWPSGDTIMRICGAKERIASVGDSESGTGIERRTGDRWMTRLIPARPGDMVELDRNAEFLTSLLGKPVGARLADLRVLSSRGTVANRVERPPVEGRFYVLFPGASAAGKRWPIASFAEIATRIHQQTGWVGVVCGGPEDPPFSQELCRTAPVPMVDLAGKTTLSQLSSILSFASLLLSNDTSAVHMAASLAVPSVCLLGGGHFGRFLPYVLDGSSPGIAPSVAFYPMDCFGCTWHCIYDVPPDQPKPCVANITVEAVWKEILNLIQQSTP